MSKPRISRQARADLREAGLALERRSKLASRRLVAEYRKAVESLAQFPMTGRARDDLMPGSRTSAVSDYVIVFRPVGDTIEVLRFLHGSRDIVRIIREETEL